MGLITKNQGNSVFIHADVGIWYTGKSAKFSATIRNMYNGVETALSGPFIENAPGDYTIQIAPPGGIYTIYVFNPELWYGHKSATLQVNAPYVSGNLII